MNQTIKITLIPSIIGVIVGSGAVLFFKTTQKQTEQDLMLVKQVINNSFIYLKNCLPTFREKMIIT